MIFNHHLLLEEEFDRKITVHFNSTDYVANFQEADLFELNKVLYSSKVKYPMIWLQTGYRKEERTLGGRILLKNCVFIFITKGDQTDRYKKRFATSYNEILYPLLDKFLTKIRRSRGVFFGDDNYSTVALPFNDVTELTARESRRGGIEKRVTESTPISDIWDALILDIDLMVNTDCYPDFFINN